MAASTKVFSLEGKGLKMTSAEDLEPHIKELREMDDVEEVRFLGNTLGIGACKLLGEVLSTKKNLQIANFADIFTGRLLSEIPEALQLLLSSILNLPKLHTMDLSDNAFGINTHAPLVEFLSSHVPLQHLFLNNNGLGPHCGILVADSLSNLHKKKEEARAAGQEVPDLETVICGRNRLENGSMTAWAKAFSLHNKVKLVKMVQNGIRPEGITHLLTEGLNKAAGLQVFNIQDNTFTLRGAKALAAALQGWPELQELGVSDCYLTGKGGIIVSQALGKGQNKKLETLRMQYNDITAVAVKNIADILEESLPGLKRLELNGNKFAEEDPSIPQLQEALEERKEKFGGDVVDEDDWGLDELDELDDESEEEEEEEEEEEVETLAERLVKEAEEAQEEPTVQVKDKEVEKLAEELAKTKV
ncbi:probable ran GTPase activating protein 1 [Cephalotrichum gorgonifer]|uniref:Probable ran GTPase activating protein 1 n=1 Tax=Cephalotrichum gorgonifer TaxID=2041049 RepID=A0AAE8MPS2_9PEZI|nr:probable ran GTPase activating protein 1 [Cephalotrichum gorgonifer]